jgi:hypothetical protein
MQECKTKHINIYMSFSNRPNLVSKARNETKSTYMDIQACDKETFSDLSSFTKRRLASHVKAYPCHTRATNMHTTQRAYKDIKLSTKDHCKHL